MSMVGEEVCNNFPPPQNAPSECFNLLHLQGRFKFKEHLLYYRSEESCVQFSLTSKMQPMFLEIFTI